MAQTVQDQDYAALPKLLHWLIALLVAAIWPLGLLIGVVTDPVKPDFYLWHESLGFIVLWLMLVRVGARLTHRPPPAQGSPVLRRVALGVHGLLYLLLIVMPVSGFLATNAHGFPLTWFGLLTIWFPIGKNSDIAWTLSAIHTWSAWTLLILIGLHVVAALVHHLVWRDRTLFRML